MAEKKWVIEVNEKLKNMVDTSSEKDHWKKRSIYKVPACVTDLNKKAYRPLAVSFGPYHYEEEHLKAMEEHKQHLKAMEEHKQRALLHFLKRSGKDIEVFVSALDEVAQELKDSYDSLDKKWQNDTSKFLQLLLLDGCFMLEILGTATHSFDSNDPAKQSYHDYAPNDPIFSNHGKLYIIPFIRRDMLMLENQLPKLVLDKLVAIESDNAKNEEFVNKLILEFFFAITPATPMGKCLHVLDVYRKSILQEKPPQRRHLHRAQKVKDDGGAQIIRSATELNEAGILFKRSKSGSLKDITFHGGVLRLPMIVVDDASESTYLNLMAFERSHVGAGNEVTSYIFFMDNIIDSDKDVALLHSRGIIQNAIGSDKAAAKLFNSLAKDTTLDPESRLFEVQMRVNIYCKKRWNEWRANLIHTYFTSPWAILSVIAAVVLFALTIAQTVYSVIPFYQSSLPPPPPPPPPPRTPPMASPNLHPPPPPTALPTPKLSHH